jgi:hypothetical protein
VTSGAVLCVHLCGDAGLARRASKERASRALRPFPYECDRPTLEVPEKPLSAPWAARRAAPGLTGRPTSPYTRRSGPDRSWVASSVAGTALAAATTFGVVSPVTAGPAAGEGELAAATGDVAGDALVAGPDMGLGGAVAAGFVATVGAAVGGTLACGAAQPARSVAATTYPTSRVLGRIHQTPRASVASIAGKIRPADLRGC